MIVERAWWVESSEGLLDDSARVSLILLNKAFQIELWVS